MHEENTGKQVRVFGELVRSNNSVPVVSADGVYDYNQTDGQGNKKTQEQLNEEFKTAIENGVTISTTERQTSVKLVEGTEFRVEAGTGVKVGKWGEVDNSIQISADTDVLATKTDLTAKADKADTYTKEQVDAAIEDVAFLCDDDGQAVIPEFDPQTDTLLKTTQSLTNTEKETVIGNILDKNYTGGSYIGKGKKYLKLNVGAPVATDFDGFVDSATTEQSSLAEVPDYVYFDRTNNIFIASKGEGLLMKYYISWQNGDAYMNPNSGVYFKNGNDYYQWNGTTLEAATVGNVNRLTQADFDSANTIYVIRYDFDLCGQSITIPVGCVLEFDGGSLSNGSLVGNSTEIKARLFKIFNTDVTLAGSWNVAEAYPEWFGAKGDNTTDNTDIINKTLGYFKEVILSQNNNYVVNGTINLNGGKCLRLKQNTTIIKSAQNDDPVISITGRGNSLLGGSKSSVIKSDSLTPYGLISICDYKDTIWNSTTFYNKVDNIQIIGPSPNSQSIQSVGIRFKHVYKENGTLYAAYYNSFTNLEIERFNIGMQFVGDVNANFVRDVVFTLCGTNNFDTDSGLNITGSTWYPDGGAMSCQENQFINVFVTGAYINASPGAACLCIGDYVKNNMFMVIGENGNQGRGIRVLGEEDNISNNTFIVRTIQYQGDAGIGRLYKNNVFTQGTTVRAKDFFASVSGTFPEVNTEKVEGETFFLDGNSIYHNGVFYKNENLGLLTEGTTYEIFSYKYPTSNTSSSKQIIRFQLCLYRANTYTNGVMDATVVLDNGNVLSYDAPILKGIAILKPIVSDGKIHFLIRPTTYNQQHINKGSGNLSVQVYSGSNTKYGVVGCIEIPPKIDDTNLTPYDGVVEPLYAQKVGTTAQRPTYPIDMYVYFDTTLGKPIFYKGNNIWVDATNVVAGTPTSGTFANKPTVATNNIPVGFKYFCTDKQTTEGATDGIEIIHKGNDVWVDALGRTIS